MSDCQKGEEGKPAAADWRLLCAQALIADIAAEVENDRRELSQAHGVTTKPFHPLLIRI